MKNRISSPDRLFSGLEPPAPPLELRDAVLGAAAEVTPREPEHDQWNRIWESRPIRLAWAASVACLITAHALITPAGGGATAVSPVAETVAADTVDDELARIAKLPRLLPGTRPLGGHGLDFNINGTAVRSAHGTALETSS